MQFKIFPPVREIRLDSGFCTISTEELAGIRSKIRTIYSRRLESENQFLFSWGGLDTGDPPDEAQGYRLKLHPTGLTLAAADAAGFRYGLDTLEQILAQVSQEPFPAITIEDAPILKHRGLMLDVSRGKVYTREYLLELTELLARCRINVLQLYVEHTFRFAGMPSIWDGADPLTPEDIIALQAKCRELGIELQANLQSLGHMNRILTRPEYRHLAESEMFWSLDTSSEASYQLLDRMYGEFLQLFDSPWVNVCSDEPYDLGRGKSRATGKSVGELYFDHLLRLHGLAAKYGKRIMLFGDVVRHHPEFAQRLPRDLICLDWIYDPKDDYGTPGLFRSTGLEYWVSPGTGNWNTLFPRLDGSITNIVNLTLEGIREGAAGMLLTDWNDHGAYTQPAPGYYLYAYAGAVAWTGRDPGREAVGAAMDTILKLPGYHTIIESLAGIYQLPPMWSKNRSQCVMALFDEPLLGASLRGDPPPPDLRAYDLTLPEGISPVYERHSQHPLRPVFSLPAATRQAIAEILEKVQPILQDLDEGSIKRQLSYIVNAFKVMLRKLEFSNQLLTQLQGGAMGIHDFLDWEDQARGLIADLVALELEYGQCWLAIARPSEIAISLTHFSQIITRLEYLRDWLSQQRETLGRGERPDWDLGTYQSAGYTTLPTY